MNLPDEALSAVIDRLVDDELDPASRRALLERLDEVPGAWRRCALAFLEAREWRRVLRSERSAHQRSLSPVAPASGPRRQIAVLCGVAAALMAAFLLGWGVRGRTSAEPLIAGGSFGLPTQPTPRAPEPRATDTAASRLLSAQLPEPTLRPAMGAGPARLLKEFEERGFRVEHRRRLLAESHEHGESLIVPIDEFDVRYVGQPTY